MNLPFFIAGRYLFARKSHNVINVISAISVAGIALASFALICTLSVFNGFHELVATLFTEFDPELKVVPAQGKFFDAGDPAIRDACALPFIEASSFSLEEQALIGYKSKQQIAVIKGVEDSFHDMSGIEGILRGNGIFMLEDDVTDYGILGIGLMGRMDCGTHPAYPLRLYVPRKDARVSLVNPAAAFNSADIYSPGVIFQVNQQKYDDDYVLISLDLARKLTGQENGASALEIRLKDGTGMKKAVRELKSVLGENFIIQDRFQQQADVFKVVKLEKFISYLFLSFILLIACFNIIGSLIMLMVEKQQDSQLLRSLGAQQSTVERIFVINGLLISLIGAVTGLLLGVIAALLQQKFGIISLGTSGSFIVDAYPVSVKMQDVLLVLATVLAVSFLSIRPIGPIARRFIKTVD